MRNLDLAVINEEDISVGDTVQYKGAEYEVHRIDGHVYPVCLGAGLRASFDELKKVEKDLKRAKLRKLRTALRRDVLNLRNTLQALESSIEVLDVLIG